MEALKYVHSRRITHRDLKPSNVLIDNDGYLVLADFGAAHTDMALEPKAAGEITCTITYRAPEVFLGRAHNCTVDYWSLGCIAYCLFTGHSPFERAGESLAELEQRIQQRVLSDYVEKTDAFCDAPEAFNLITALLHKNPALRLGARGIAEIQSHPFFDGFDFEALKERRLPGVPFFK